MGLTMRQKQAVTKQLALSYQKAGKRKKGELLDWVIQLTGYNRSYAARVLQQRAKPKVLGRLKDGNATITLVADERTKRPKSRRSRPSKYGKEVLVALSKIWVICDGICGKRLAPYLSEIIPVLQRWGEVELDEQVRKKLLAISPATIDRLLAPLKRRYQLRARATTKPGTLLRHQIPIRTFSEWNEGRPGFVEVDLVAHEGGEPRGDFLQTLDLTDVFSGWTEGGEEQGPSVGL